MSDSISGIYEIVNTINGHRYIGSSQNVQVRWRSHLSTLKNGCHDNSHLNRAWRAYGPVAFKFKILEESSIADLAIKEQHWIDSYPQDQLYNLAAPVAGSARGYKYTPEQRARHSEGLKRIWADTPERYAASVETRAKRSAAHKGRIFSAETRAKLSAARKRCIASDATRAKMSATRKGHLVSDEARAKISAANKGRIVSDETRAKMSAAMTGRIASLEAKAKMRVAMTGRKASDETKAKISAANKGHVTSDETRAKISAANKGHSTSDATRAKMSATREA